MQPARCSRSLVVALFRADQVRVVGVRKGLLRGIAGWRQTRNWAVGPGVGGFVATAECEGRR